MKTFKLFDKLINRSSIGIDDFFREFFLVFRADRQNPFDGGLVRFRGKYVENKAENLPYDPKIGLIMSVMSGMDQMEDGKLFLENKTEAALVLKSLIICWIYHFEFENELLDEVVRLKLEPEIFSIIENIEDMDWTVDVYLDFFRSKLG